MNGTASARLKGFGFNDTLGPTAGTSSRAALYAPRQPESGQGPPEIRAWPSAEQWAEHADTHTDAARGFLAGSGAAPPGPLPPVGAALAALGAAADLAAPAGAGAKERK